MDSWNKINNDLFIVEEYRDYSNEKLFQIVFVLLVQVNLFEEMFEDPNRAHELFECVNGEKLVCNEGSLLNVANSAKLSNEALQLAKEEIHKRSIKNVEDITKQVGEYYANYYIHKTTI